MKRLCIIAAAFLLLPSTYAAAQENDQTSIRDMAEKAADALARQLDLDDYQIFLVDSTFLHDYTAMSEESQQLQRSQATNLELYLRVRDKWGNSIDSTFSKLFTPEQWKKYMKTEFGREKRARDKRIAKRLKAEESK